MNFTIQMGKQAQADPLCKRYAVIIVIFNNFDCL